MATMKALVKGRPEPGLWLEEVSIPEIGINDVLITGAGPIGCMAAAIAKHAGARYVVVTDVNPYRLKLAQKMGATLTVDVRSEKIEAAQKQLAMKEGFNVGLEMSGNPEALDSILCHMYHGGKVALLGIFPQKTAIDWDLVVFNGLLIKGIYGREMYETWYKMTAMIQTGLELCRSSPTGLTLLPMNRHSTRCAPGDPARSF